MIRSKTVRVITASFIVYFAFFAVYYFSTIRVSQANKQLAYENFEASFPIPFVEKSFRSFSTPPWAMSHDQIENKEMFLTLLERDDLFAIYRERDYWSRELIYYVAFTTSEHSTVVTVYRFKPQILEIDNGFFTPKTYQIL